MFDWIHNQPLTCSLPSFYMFFSITNLGYDKILLVSWGLNTILILILRYRDERDLKNNLL